MQSYDQQTDLITDKSKKYLKTSLVMNGRQVYLYLLSGHSSFHLYLCEYHYNFLTLIRFLQQMVSEEKLFYEERRL